MMPISSDYTDAIKQSEGFAPTANWDYKQYTNGYGTRAQSPNETIDRATAQQRFDDETGKAASFVDSINPSIPAGARAALTSLTFNAGPHWANSGLGAAVRAGDMGAAKDHFLQYVNVGGAPNAALTTRRNAEAQWFNHGQPTGQPTPVAQAMSQPQGAPQMDPTQDPTAMQSAMNGVRAFDPGSTLQHAGAWLQSISNPAGGAAMLGAVNNPLLKQRFSVTKDNLGNMLIVDNHTGMVRDARGNTVGGGGMGQGSQQPGAAGAPAQAPDVATQLASSPVALEARAKADQETSSKTLEALSQGAADARVMKSKVEEALTLSRDPNVHQGAYGNLWGHLKNTAASVSGGAFSPEGTDQTAALQKIFTNLQGQYLSAQKGVRFAGPEIKFSEGANPDMDKPDKVNQQILQDYSRAADLPIKAFDLANQHMQQYGVLGPRYHTELQKMYADNPASKLDAIQPSAAASDGGGTGAFKVLKVH